MALSNALLVFFIFFFVNVGLYAEDTAKVKNIKASKSVAINKQFFAQVSVRVLETKSTSDYVDPRLEDLKDKFKDLPFKSFRLSADSSKIMPLKQKHSVRLVNGQLVHLRLIDHNQDSGTLWVKWLTPEGEMILDTRLNLVFNDAMVVAVEQGKCQKGLPHGLALAVKVSPVIP